MTHFSPFWGNFFKDLFIWLIIGWQDCILGWVSDKYSYLLKTCCNYIFQVLVIFGHFRKVVTFALETYEKIKIWLIQEQWIYFEIRNSQIFRITNIMTSWLSANLLKKYTFTCWLLVCILFEVNQRFLSIHSFHAGSHAPTNNFKPSSSEENIIKSCIFKSNYFFWQYFSDVEIVLNTFKK